MAAASLAGLALSPAFAQSSVTLYGIMDAGLARVSNIAGGGSTQVRSGNLYTSRFGFRGTEDLGGGLKANFNLEAGLNVDTGTTSTPYFNRQSWLGLSSSSLGSVSMGRMLPTINDLFIASLQASYFGNPSAAIDGAATGAGSSAARFNNMLGGTRVDNAIKYQSPVMAGFQGHAMAALGEVTGSSSAGRILSLGGGYNASNIEAGLAYHERQCGEAGGCPVGKDTDKIFGLGAAYKLDGARYALLYTQERNALNVKDANADVLSLLARMPFGQWVAAGGFQFLNDKTPLNQDVRQVNLALNYLLSKRTQLYGLYSYQTVKNGGKAGMFATTSSSNKQGQLSLGIAHTF
nr:porin [Xylophilus sp. ASV27]